MTTTPDLGIPELAQAQANPDVTHNEALVLMQALLNGVIDKDLTSPPGSPTEGDAYLINTAAPTGAWSGYPYRIAIYWGGSWRFVPGVDDAGTPVTMGTRQEGLRVWVRDENRVYVWTNSVGSPTAWHWVPLLGTWDTGEFYQKGTWTPVLTCATPGDLAITYSTQLGEYDIVGDTVTLRFAIVTSAFTWTTASGAIKITGNPITNQTKPGLGPRGLIGFNGYTSANYELISASINSAGTDVIINKFGEGQAANTVDISDLPSGGTITLQGSLNYRKA